MKDAADLLSVVYTYLPEAFLFDLIVFQCALRWSYWRSNSPSRS